MDSLRECVSCQEIKDSSYLLPCLHAACSQCIADFVKDSQTKKTKQPHCCACGETFVQDKLMAVPSATLLTPTCFDCDEPATHYCSVCKNNMCKAHAEAHRLSKRTKEHDAQLIAEVPFCNKHSTETAVGFCTNCKLLVCTNCMLTEHNKTPHLSVTLQEVAKATSDSVKKDVAKLLESLPAIDKEIKKHTNTRAKLEKERAELEAKIADIRKQEKVTALQIEDLEKTKALLLTTQTQANTLASTATTLPHSTLLRLQSVITTRVSNLQAGLGLISGLVSVVPSTKTLPVTVFNRVFTQSLNVSNNGKTITNIKDRNWGYGISDDGCSSGVRSWRITINSINASSYFITFGIWNSSNAPASGYSFAEANAWVFYCYNGGTHVYKAGSYTNLNSTSPLQSSNVILLTVDANQSRLTVQNTTRGWTRTIDQLPPPNPAYYPHVLLYQTNESVTIEAAS